MMNWFFRWWTKGFNRNQQIEMLENRAVGQACMARNFDGGISFELIDAENGKILKVMVPNPSAGGGHVGGFNTRSFNPHTGRDEKLWVIPEGENVIEFVTRALVEERIK